MGFTVRLARPDDVAHIVPWTTDTFEWGDYVPDRLPIWLDDDASAVLVCSDEDDLPLAVSHAVMLSPNEGWIEAARVHPDHRRAGMGVAMNRAGVEWARDRGGRVMRLATEASNEAARLQVTKLGYRKVSSWVYASMKVDPGHRGHERHRLRPAPGPDAEAAWLSWVGSDLALGGRELIALGWQWRTARPVDVVSAASRGEFFQSPAGWVIADMPQEDWLRSLWVATGPDDILGLLDGLIDLAASREATEVTIKLPNLPWTAEALTRVGGTPKEVLVYSLAI
jgi:GNAT superfamily N-acetyltransferase